VARVVGQHDELLVQPKVGHVTPVRGPRGPDVLRKNDADSCHGGPPADGEAAIRLTLISVRRAATGYPPAAGPGQELPITTAPLPVTPDRSGVTGARELTAAPTARYSGRQQKTSRKGEDD
jgi:hypothetical protein